MKLILYKCYNDSNTINKNLTEPLELDIKLKKTQPISSPLIILKDDNGKIDAYNYAYIEFFKRYYFITKNERGNNNTINLQLDCDVLESFKTDILNSDSIIKKSNKSTYADIPLSVDSRSKAHTFKSDVTLPDKTTTILTTIGG